LKGFLGDFLEFEHNEDDNDFTKPIIQIAANNGYSKKFAENISNKHEKKKISRMVYSGKDVTVDSYVKLP